MGAAASLRLLRTCVLLQAVLLSMKWESPVRFVCQVHPGGGRCFCREVRGFPSCWWVRWPRRSTLPMMLLARRGVVPGGVCVEVLAGSLASSPCSPTALDETAGRLPHACCAMARPSEQQCLYSRNVCALFCVDPVKERDQDVLPDFPDEVVFAIQLTAHATVNSVRNVS